MTEPTGEDRLGRSFGRPVTEPTNDDPFLRSFGRPVTEPTGEARLGGSFGRPVTDLPTNRHGVVVAARAAGRRLTLCRVPA